MARRPDPALRQAWRELISRQSHSGLSIARFYRTADMMTLCSSAIRNDLDVYAYIKDVLDSLLSGSTDYASLRPDAWAKSHPESVRHYRAEERRQRNARRDRARLDRRLSQSESK